MADARETQLLHAFVELAEAVVTEDFDVAEFLHLVTQRACEVIDVAEVGLLLATGGTLHVMASSSERTRSLELFQLHNEDGPCIDCFRTGTAVIVEDLDNERRRWPHFVPAARDAGFASAYALPLRLRQDRIGVLGLFGETPGRLGEFDLVAGQALADVATIAILQQRDIQESLTTTDQLRTALASRVIIEQAKGLLSERCGIPMDDCFQQLRSYARSHNRRLHDVAQELVNGTIPAGAFGAPSKPKARRGPGSRPN